mgnify:CR=1 FL=1
MTSNFSEGFVRCHNSQCPSYLRWYSKAEVKHNGLLRRGRCPSCHFKVRTRTRDTKYVSEADSQPLAMIEVKGRR